MLERQDDALLAQRQGFVLVQVAGGTSEQASHNASARQRAAAVMCSSVVPFVLQHFTGLGVQVHVPFTFCASRSSTL
jgi:hypothetical protein